MLTHLHLHLTEKISASYLPTLLFHSWYKGKKNFQRQSFLHGLPYNSSGTGKPAKNLSFYLPISAPLWTLTTEPNVMLSLDQVFS